MHYTRGTSQNSRTVSKWTWHSPQLNLIPRLIDHHCFWNAFHPQSRALWSFSHSISYLAVCGPWGRCAFSVVNHQSQQLRRLHKQRGSPTYWFLLGSDSIHTVLQHFLFLPADLCTISVARPGLCLSPLAGFRLAMVVVGAHRCQRGRGVVNIKVSKLWPPSGDQCQANG